MLCPIDYGAFKQTTNGKWAHLLCAIWINETGVSNTVYMEPIDGVDVIPKGRWKLICYLCKKRVGACIQCSKGSCYTAYHATCAREYGLHLRLGTNSGMTTADEAPGANVSYCDRHGPNAQLLQRQRDESEELASGTPGAAVGNAKRRKLLSYGERHGSAAPAPGTPGTPRSSVGPLLPLPSAKLHRAHNKALAPLPAPIIPQYIYDKLWEYIKPLKFRQKALFVRLVCRYWSLKRESRRGAPLLKRLHLEVRMAYVSSYQAVRELTITSLSSPQPWTAAGASRQATDIEKEKKLELLLLLRNDLEKVRTLTELVKKREREKLRRSALVKTIVEQVVFPRSAIFRAATRSIISLDARGLFTNPVDRQDVPDYYEIITHPMCWARILEKIDQNAYLRPGEFAADVRLTLDNALRYNKAEDVHARNAVRLKMQVEPVLQALEAALDNQQQHSAVSRLHAQVLGLVDEKMVKELTKIWYPKPAVTEQQQRQHSARPTQPAVSPAPQQTAEANSAAPHSLAVPAAPHAAVIQHPAPVLPPPRVDAGVAALTTILSSVAQMTGQGNPLIDAQAAGGGSAIPPEIRVTAASGTAPRSSTAAYANSSKKRKRMIPQDNDNDVGFRIVAPTEQIGIVAGAEGPQLTEWEKREAMLARKREAERIKREAKKARQANWRSSSKKSKKGQGAGVTVGTTLLQTPLVLDQQQPHPPALAAYAAEAGAGAADVHDTAPQQLDDETADTTMDYDDSTFDGTSLLPVDNENYSAMAGANSTQAVGAPVGSANFRDAPALQEPQQEEEELQHEPTFATAQSINEWGMEVDREDVTNHDSFLLFNSGWVLPEGSTRRRARSAFAESASTAPGPRYKPSEWSERSPGRLCRC